MNSFLNPSRHVIIFVFLLFVDTFLKLLRCFSGQSETDSSTLSLVITVA